jgi:hypothetical protein
MNASVEEKDGVARQAEPFGSPLTLASLEQAVRSADPTTLLILPRLLRRVIKQDCQLTGWALRVPHRKTYVISRQRLLEIVDPGELDLAADSHLPEEVILLARPNPEKLATRDAGETLIHCWRLLFHARVHQALDEALRKGVLSPAVVGQRIYQLGPVEFDEIRAVLAHEGYMLPPCDDVQVYVELAAVYLELRHFAPSLLARYFPSLDDLPAVDRILANDLDADSLFLATRPAGAPDPVDVSAVNEWEDGSEDEEPHANVGRPVMPCPNEDKFHRFMRKAEKAAAIGNIVRSLIHRARAVEYASGEAAPRARAAVRISLDRLLRRLQQSLGIPHDDLKRWRETLLALVYQAPHGIWPAEARLLYDLQKVCVDYERGIYTVDLVEWALSLGERPIQRSLPSQRDVLMSKHLRSASARLPAVRLSDTHRRELSALLRSVVEQTEERLRQHFRPLLADALDTVGLEPKNIPEQVARNKLVEELLDQIVERGHLAMGDLRDALSRNNLKLPDFSQTADFLRGDQLLRADRRLATSLDGVYRRGEFYLRWMQQLSSLGFGTRVGRFLTRYVAVPFGGSFVALTGLRHLIAEVTHVQLAIDSAPAIFIVGVFLLALLNLASFRHGVWQAVKTACGLARQIVVDPLTALVHAELIQWIVHSRLFILTSRFVLKPLIFTACVYLILPLELVNTRASIGTGVMLFLTANLLLNSRAGREAEEVAVDWLVQSWHRFGFRLLAGLFWMILDLFKWLLENVERLLYTVDEWLRFRTGESRVSFAAKAVLGLVWFVLTYVIRFCVNLLIEPQINPIKHFPVVTVSHKLLLPCIPAFAGVLELTMERGLAIAVATAVITGIPGIFGFLVWELKGNWRLYAANRADRLLPVPIGHHGETMVRLLKPGFHSGTLPKRFAKLRRAERKARISGSWRAVRKHLRVLQHLELAVRRYVERELLTLLAAHAAWKDLRVEIEDVHLASNRVRVSLGCPQLGPTPLEIAFELESGWLLAGLVKPGWLEQLSSRQRQVLANALAGLYKLAGTDLIREQIASLLPLTGLVYKVTDQGLVVSPDVACHVEVLYNWADEESGETLLPQVVYGASSWQAPALTRPELIYSTVSIRWQDWSDAWDDDTDSAPKPLTSMRILPGG